MGDNVNVLSKAVAQIPEIACSVRVGDDGSSDDQVVISKPLQPRGATENETSNDWCCGQDDGEDRDTDDCRPVFRHAGAWVPKEACANGEHV